jgi:aryl-alcohol dehydrogenase-like predicted oxidoreductase
MWGGTEEAEAVTAIQASLDAGIDFIDTAPAYGLGLSEEIVRKAIAGRRDQVVLATKCGLVWHTQKGTHFFNEHGRPVYRYLGPESIRHELEQSLRRLGTDYIDLYQTHWQDSTTPIARTMETLMRLKEEGKIRAIGVSNVSLAELREYEITAAVDSDQENYSMLLRQHEADLLPHCRDKKVAFLAYSPMARGLLTGKVGPDRRFQGDDHRAGDPLFTQENRHKVAGFLAELDPLSRALSLTPAQLVIAWTAMQPGVTHVLCGVRNAAQALENAAAGNVPLPETVSREIDALLVRHGWGPPAQ